MSKEIDFTVAPLESMEAPGLGLLWLLTKYAIYGIFVVSSVTVPAF